ncbi:nucleoside 2-deoxyribosyltransferase [Vibrio sp. 99K-1]|uniref:nucleoside 2-deoxyribosyltransferase n=1 Tax=Vibrio sp. 99K-1 TaxID=2607603 RepID=UPI00149347DB|nr:nucleoside 2-deoxyribosyltransferase [Vibrio sp. 99K-1]NOI87063.1 sugar kinase [Vibrio sp. 99K-1]
MVLVVGEVFVDYTLSTFNEKCKIRLGGVVHACRGLWASDKRYSAAIICPEYLQKEAQSYLIAHGCEEVIILGDITGSPNVISISDVKELAHQGYEDLLRDNKKIKLKFVPQQLDSFEDVLIFPGSFNLEELFEQFSSKAKFSFDIAYGIESFSELDFYRGRISLLLTSTSSELFESNAKQDITPLIDLASSLSVECFILKENRGGSRVFDLTSDTSKRIPAKLGRTQNSVGVGDVYSAAAIAHKDLGWENAAWIASIAATSYSQTTFPDDFKRDVQRNLSLPLNVSKGLGGVCLPWHERPKYNIYLAAPDFSYIDRKDLDYAIASMEYHNFTLRRPIVENGELNEESSELERKQTYFQDVKLIEECDVVFAIPLNRDPGTLIEIGIAQATQKPVVTYDPKAENDNNMVIMGSNSYSTDLDSSLNSIFDILSGMENE